MRFKLARTVIAGLSVALIDIAVIVAYTHGLWWFAVGMAFVWVRHCLIKVQKGRDMAQG